MGTRASKFYLIVAAVVSALILQGCRQGAPEARITDGVIGWLRGPTLRTGDGADTEDLRVAITGSKASVVNALLDRAKSYRAREVMDSLELRLSSGGMPIMFKGGTRHALFVVSQIESFDPTKGRPTDFSCLPIDRPKRCSAPGSVGASSLDRYCQHLRQIAVVYSRYPVMIKPLSGNIAALPIEFVDKNGEPLPNSASESGVGFNGYDVISPNSRDLYVVIKEWARCDGDSGFKPVITRQSVGWHLESFGVAAR